MYRHPREAPAGARHSTNPGGVVQAPLEAPAEAGTHHTSTNTHDNRRGDVVRSRHPAMYHVLTRGAMVQCCAMLMVQCAIKQLLFYLRKIEILHSIIFVVWFPCSRSNFVERSTGLAKHQVNK